MLNKIALVQKLVLGRPTKIEPDLNSMAGQTKNVYTLVMMINYFCRLLMLLLFISRGAQASYIDINFLSFSDTFQAATDTKINRTMYDAGIGILMGKSGGWVWALSYGGGTYSDTVGSTMTYTFTDLGIKMGYFWNKQKNWFSTFTYNFDSRAKYNDDAGEIELRGTSIKIDVGYVFWPSEIVGIAAKIFFYTPTFKESISSGTLTTVNYRRSVIYPSLSLLFKF